MLPVLLIADNASLISTTISDLLLSEDVKDVFTYGENESILIDTIREINQNVLQPAFRKRAFVLYGFDKIKNDGQNALLKSLEERNEDNVFILIAQDEYKVLPTILSRCHVLHSNTDDAQDYSILEELELFELQATSDLLISSQKLAKGIHADAISQLRSYLYKIAHNKDIDKRHQKNIYNVLERVVEVEYQLKNNIYPEFTLDYILLTLKNNKLLPLPA